MNNDFEIDTNLIRLAKILQPYSKLYIVGGFVRDFLLKKNGSDIDLASNLEIKRLKEILKDTPFEVVEKSATIGSCKIMIEKKSYDYTTFRKESYKKGKHFPEKIEFVDDIKEDCMRRDFTINALYLDILSKEILDFVDGQEDIKLKQLKVVNKSTLKHDGERILRLVKYACLLNLKIERETFLMAKENCKNVYDLSDNMINSYRKFFLNLSLFKKLKAKRIFNKLGLKNFLK